jgi:hypothetical protein
MIKKTITFETKCWESDWESIVKNMVVNHLKNEFMPTL